MSLWSCPSHGLYGGQVTCPKCGFQGTYVKVDDSVVLDLKRDHRMIGPKDEAGESWAVQDGKIFGWSESNCRFEEAWWLNSDGTPLTNPTNLRHIQNLCRDRPFDPAWLNEEQVNDRPDNSTVA